MNHVTRDCEICESPIHGKPFSLASLKTPHRVLKVCEKCAGSEFVSLGYAGIELLVHRDDYLRADQERLWHAVDAVWNAATECGWKVVGLRIQGKNEAISDPVEGLF